MALFFFNWYPDKALATQIRKKQRHKLMDIKSEREVISLLPINIKRKVRVYSEQLHANKSDNLDETHDFWCALSLRHPSGDLAFPVPVLMGCCTAAVLGILFNTILTFPFSNAPFPTPLFLSLSLPLIYSFFLPKHIPGILSNRHLWEVNFWELTCL